MSKAKIRLLKRSEIPKIIALHKDSIVPIWKKHNRPFNLRNIKKYFEKRFTKEKIYVIEKYKKIIACGSILIENNYADLGIILVSKKEQGRGYGKRIMSFLEDIAKKRGAKRITLDVLLENPALDFYKHLGYKPFKLIMQKEL